MSAEVTEWGWNRLSVHIAYNEEDARDMAAGVPGAVVVKRTVTYGDWEQA